MNAVSIQEIEEGVAHESFYSEVDGSPERLMSANDGLDDSSEADIAGVTDGHFYVPLSLDEEKRLIELIRQGDTQARARLVEGAMGVVHFWANRYRSNFISKEDVIQEGYIGLMYAVDAFKTDMSCRFPVYAQWWVRSFMQKSLIRAHFIRVPDYLAKQVHAAVARGEDVQKTGKMSDEIKKAIATFNPFVASLDRPANSPEEDDDYAINPVDTNTLEPYQAIRHDRLRDLLMGYIDRLPFQQKQVLSMRFGLHGRAEMTLEEIGSLTCHSRESVRQMQNRGLLSLRKLMAADQVFMEDVL